MFLTLSGFVLLNFKVNFERTMFRTLIPLNAKSTPTVLPTEPFKFSCVRNGRISSHNLFHVSVVLEQNRCWAMIKEPIQFLVDSDFWNSVIDSLTLYNRIVHFVVYYWLVTSDCRRI